MAKPARPEARKLSTAACKTTLLVCGLAWLCHSLPASAQESDLRGTVSDKAPLAAGALKNKAKKPKKNAADLTTPLPAYQPASTDGLPDRTANDASASDGLPSGDIIVAPAAKPLTGKADPEKKLDGALASDVPDADQTLPALTDENPEAFKRAERDNLRENAIDGVKRKNEADPYAAPGISLGTFTLKPTFDTGMRWTSNSDNSANGKAALLSESSLRLRADSNWSQHRLGFEAAGAWQKSLTGPKTSDPDFSLGTDFQFDFSNRTALTGTLGWSYSKEAASSPASVVGALSRPDLSKLTGSLGIAHDAGIIKASAKLNAERGTYGNATDSLGVSVSQQDRDNTYFGLTLRAGYNVSSELSPFIEGEIGRRVFDNATDSFGLNRAATRYAIRAGVEANLSEKLKGDIALGYLVENIDDSALEDIAGLSLAGNINWSPMRGTNVALTALTTVEGSSSATSSGSLLNGVTLALTRKVRENLDLNANAGISLRNYSGPSPNEITLSAGAGFVYWFNRYVGLNSRIAHQSVLSSDTARQSQSNSVYLGITLRR